MNQVVDKPSLESLLTSKEFTTMLEALAYKALRGSYRFAQEHPIVSRQDLISEGTASAIAAYKNFDPAKGAWTSYTYMYVLNAMQVFCKKNCHQLSISERDSRHNLADMTNIGVVRLNREDERRDGSNVDIPVGSGVELGEYELDDYYFRGFAPQDVAMFKEHHLEDRTLQEIATKYRTSKSNVFLVVERLTERIRERIETYEQNDRDPLPKLRQAE